MKIRSLGTAILAGLLALGTGACTDPEGAERLLEQQGYTDVRAGGYAIMSCGRDDTYQTKFVAKSPNGQTVHGAVCRGMLFKNSTIRFN